MTHPPALFTLFGCTVRYHWTVALSIPLIAGYCTGTENLYFAGVFSIITLCVYVCVLLQGFVHVFVAKRFGFRTRDFIIYPFWTTTRFTIISERPWQEMYISFAGPMTHGLIAAGMYVILKSLEVATTFPTTETLDYNLTILAYVAWCNLLLALLHLFPVLPLDMGQAFRAALSLTSSRLHASEIAANLSTIGSLALLLFGMTALQSPLLAFLAITLYLSSQEDLGRARYFASIKADKLDVAEPPQAIMIPMDSIIDESCKPPEERFTGFTWNRKARLWIQWLDGQPVGANALVGD